MGASGAFLAGRDCARVLFCGIGFCTYYTNGVSRAFLRVVSILLADIALSVWAIRVVFVRWAQPVAYCKVGNSKRLQGYSFNNRKDHSRVGIAFTFLRTGKPTRSLNHFKKWIVGFNLKSNFF
jgi:hypothetical protein